MNEREIKIDLLSRTEITFSALRKEFGLTYFEAKNLVDSFVEDGFLQRVSGMTYTVQLKPKEKPQEETEWVPYGLRRPKWPGEPSFFAEARRQSGEHEQKNDKEETLQEAKRRLMEKLASIKSGGISPCDDMQQEAPATEESGSDAVQKPKKKEKTETQEEKSQIQTTIDDLLQPKTEPKDDANVSVRSDYDEWKERHHADAKNFPDNELEIPRLVWMGLKDGVQPDCYNKVTVTGYGGRKFSIDLTLREDRKVMWFSMKNDVDKMANKLVPGRVREILSDFSGVKYIKGALFVTVHDLKQVVGAIINLCGAYEALFRATDFF